MMDLEALLRDAQAGEPGAWDALVPSLYANLRPYFRQQFGDFEAIELTQRTVEAVARQLPGFTARQSLTAWVFGIARNHARMEHRERKRRELLAILTVDVIAAPVTSPSARIHAHERATILLEEIEKLPSIYRRIVEHDLEDGDLGTLLEREDIRPGTARSRRHRAYAMLRQQITARLSSPPHSRETSSSSSSPSP